MAEKIALGHKVVPVEQAVSELKDLLKSDLKSLQDKRDKYKGVETTYKEVIQVIGKAGDAKTADIKICQSEIPL
ncbi:hypothetical protein KUCAC02_032880 [Chaenocephalus aceratus]|nr:hypothetical protein KUCAC02_032880 [Chaenocephalus aceratus]